MMSIKKYIKEHKEIKLMIFYIIFIILFALIQKFIIPKYPNLVTSEIDYIMPYNKYFILAYALWWPFVPVAFIFFYFRDTKSFKALCFQMFTVCFFTLYIYIIYPSYLDLRRPITENDIFSNMILWLRSIDPPRNVYPSLHVSETLSICYVVYFCKDKILAKPVKYICYIIGVLIIVSTILIDQHAISDIVFAIVLSLIALLSCPSFEDGDSSNLVDGGEDAS